MRRSAGALLALGLGLVAMPARAAPPAAGGFRPVPVAGVAPHGFPSRVTLGPGIARLGQPVRYRAWVVVPRAVEVRWVRPASGGALEWSAPEARRRHSYSGSELGRGDAYAPDTAVVEFTLRAFALGMVPVPGLAFRVADQTGRWREGRLPTARLAVVPVIPPADTAADLRPLRGPLGAPWWERVPWRIVGVVALALASLAFVVLRLGRRRNAPAPATAAAAKDPALEALQALEALRGLRLPEHGRFAEHAFHLTRILRLFLEVTEGTPRPGDTTPELLTHLESARLGPADLGRLAGLLFAWDRVKFARAASSLEEARRAEAAVEDLVRRRAQVAGEEAA